MDWASEALFRLQRAVFGKGSRECTWKLTGVFEMDAMMS
jgi:hypothetical protein